MSWRRKHIESISNEDYERLWRWMVEHHDRRQERPQILNGAPTSREERARSTQNWLAENRSRYAGEWVALDGDRLIGHGKDGRQVLTEAKASGVRNPFFGMLSDDESPFGGW